MDILSGLDLAQQFPRIAADAARGDLDDLDLAAGSTTNVPRSARPTSSISTSKLRLMAPVGSPTMVYSILLIAGEVSCQALCAKCVSVETL